MDQLIPGQQPHQASDVSAADSGNDDQDFLCGIALSVYQNSGSGGHETNWGAWENRRYMFQPTIAVRIGTQSHFAAGPQIRELDADTSPFAALQHGDKCGTSNDFWNLYEADIQRAAELNVKLFRLSIEWSRIQPRPGEVDLAAVQRYHQMFDIMNRCTACGCSLMSKLSCAVYTVTAALLASQQKPANAAGWVCSPQ